ncbi:MAG TPA: ATP-binding protein [Thermoleophilaceae bacterium]|nr:ATP-binding protein [Thermoleophilaceae bacterium]
MSPRGGEPRGARPEGGGALSLRTGLLLAMAYVLLLAILALGVPLALNVRDRVDSEVRSQARSQADVVAATASDLLGDDRAGLAELARISATSVRGRVVIVDRGGRVLADSAGAATRGQDYGNRPEVAAALDGSAVQETRHSDTLDEELLATAVPVIDNRRPAGAVRVTQSVDAVGRSVRRSVTGLALLGAVVLLLGLAVGWVIARRIARPLDRLDTTARQIADGDLERRAPVEGTSEQRSLARSFNTMTSRLARALQAQRQFVADASHQLRTPLTGLRLRLEEARAESRDAAAREEIDHGIAEVDRLSAMVEELLVLSRAGEADALAEAETVDLGEAVDAARQRWAGPAREGSVDLAVRHTNGALPARCSPAALDRAVDSLVENAIRYSPSGSAVEIVAGDGMVEVLDRGPGLAPGEEETVLRRFHRGSAGRRGPAGTGLGLAIAQELAGTWGGELRIANRGDGSGARATLTWGSAASSESGSDR